MSYTVSAGFTSRLPGGRAAVLGFRGAATRIVPVIEPGSGGGAVRQPRCGFRSLTCSAGARFLPGLKARVSSKEIR